ncbi:MAG: Na+/H+ antiporter subunit E [Kiloniellales bacterium]|nr:Na+/H+ antiporter subunit E [Kiloniellales bacterium]
MLRTASLGVFLALLWLLLSGHFSEPLLLALGAASVLLVVFIALRKEVTDPEGHPIHMILRLLVYWPWLVKEIVVANVDVAKAILRSPMAIDPTVFTVRGTQKSELARVIYANSITLTPGTVTVDLEEDLLTIHALTKAGLESVESGQMNRRVTALEGKR